MSDRPALRIIYVIGTYPLLTTTFIDREIAGLRRRGVDVRVVSLRHPHGTLSPGQTTEGVEYVRPVRLGSLVRSHLTYLLRSPGTYLKTLAGLVSAPHPSLSARAKTAGHFVLAVHVTAVIAGLGPADRIHAHFVDRAALVALVAARFLDLPYSATAHANDIYVDPVLLDLKLGEADFVATCTGANATHLKAVAPGASQVRTLYHGLDVGAYDPGPRPPSDRPVLLAVGQLKEKKGFSHLVEACRLLVEAGRSFTCEIVGEGPLRPQLEQAIAANGLDDVVSLRGALPHEQVKAAYRRAEVFVLPCVVGADGDRDGIPNVILEAMASGLPVVSTDLSGIPEAVEDGVSGLLVPPGDAPALAQALSGLLDDSELRRRFGEMGRKLVADAFDVEANVERLLREYAQ
jgi:glycosyltransferase involved in cell wall biosynthesis